jgi:hypothetical protein
MDMLANAVVATDSQLGRTGTDTTVTRSSLMKELEARGLRITEQRRLIVSIIQESPRHLDAATLHKTARKQDPTIDRSLCIERLRYSRIGVDRRTGSHAHRR